jgi:hypothetical protein
MNIITHTINTLKIAEIISEDILIQTNEDGLELLGNIYYQDFDRLILHSKNITPAFFDLKNGMAGEILQKFSNYRVRLSIVGDFSNYASQSIKDFMHESNKAGRINFVGSLDEALNKLSALRHL